jgi:hypothetical protein
MHTRSRTFSGALNLRDWDAHVILYSRTYQHWFSKRELVGSQKYFNFKTETLHDAIDNFMTQP